MPSVTATFEIRNDRLEEHDGEAGETTDHHQGHGSVSVDEKRRREITLSRELEDVEDAVWAIETKEYEVVWDLWEHVNGEDYDDWGFYSPYPDADVSVNLDHNISLHDVVWHIAKREDAEPPGVYLDLIHDRRIYGELDGSNISGRIGGFCSYLEALGVDLSYWAHGHADLTKYDSGHFPEEMLDHAGYEYE